MFNILWVTDSNVDLGVGRITLKMFFLKVSIEGLDWKFMSVLFQDRVESGKKLYIYLSVLHDIS